MGRAMLWAPVALLAAFARFASADFEITSPKAGAKVAAGSGSLVVEWKESGDGPTLAEFTSYELFLCAGGNTEGAGRSQWSIKAAAPPAGTTTGTGIISTSWGASTPNNAYYIMVIATGPKGTVRNFSKRFSLSGMTGTFLPEVKAALEDVEGTDGPARIGETAAGGAPAPGDDLYDVPYAMQTGFTRYAPMQPIPPTKITKKDFKPLNPTSAFTIATTFLPLPKIHTTITQSQTYSVSSQENPVPAASHPTDDMEKFLARWKD